MAGGVSSLNVSAAGAVVLYEAFRQRRAAVAPACAARPAPPARLNQRNRKAWVHEVSFPGPLAVRASPSPLASMALRPLSLGRAQPQSRRLPRRQTTPARAPASSPAPSRHRSSSPAPPTKTARPPPRSSPAVAASRQARWPPRPPPTDAERQAVTFTAFDMDVHLRPAEQQIAVRALRHRPQRRQNPARPHPAANLLFAQLGAHSRRSASDVAFPVATLNSDADHTGQLHEAAVPLAAPLAPGQTLQLDVTYSGAIAPSAQRLLAIGTPDDVALHSDWDADQRPLHRPARLRQRRLVSRLQRPRHSRRRRAPLRRDGRAQAAPQPARASVCASPSNFPTARRPPSPSSTATPSRSPSPTSSYCRTRKSPASPLPTSTAQSSALKPPASLSPSAPPTPAANLTLWTLPETKPPSNPGPPPPPRSRPSCKAGSASSPAPSSPSSTCPTPTTRPLKPAPCWPPPSAEGPPGAVGRHPGPRPHPRLDAVARAPGSRGRGPLHGHSLG